MKKWRCSICGEVFEGENPPDPCPVCAAPANLIEEVVENGQPVQTQEKKIKKWRCTVCNKVFEGEVPPEICPVCSASANLFEAIETEEEVNTSVPIKPGISKANTKWRCSICGQVFEGASPPVPCPVCKAGIEAFEKLEPAAGVVKKDTDDRFVLVGGGVAAVAAARAIRKRNKTAAITIVAGEPCHPYNRPSLSNVVAQGLPLEEILLEKPEFYTQNQMDVLCGNPVEKIDTAAKQVTLADGTALSYTKLLLATGANPFNPLKSEGGAIPVKVLRNYAHAQELIKEVSGHRVVLAGGGILGLEAAIALRARNSVVSVVEIAERILPLQTDEKASALLSAALKAQGIQLYTGHSVSSLAEDGVILNDGSKIVADIVLASMGVRSETALANEIGLQIGRGIIVDDFMHTSHTDIWAAGDCAEYNGRVLAIAGAAASMGEIAGASMAGDETEPYQPFTPATSFRFTGFSLFSTGTVSKETNETILYQKDNEFYKRLFYEDGKISGTLFVNALGGAKAVAAVSSKLAVQETINLLI